MNLKRLLFGKRLIVLIGVLLTMAAAPVGILTLNLYMDASADETTQQQAVFNDDYNDDWVEDFPKTIEGFRVARINTPKNLACSSRPEFTLHVSQATLDEFLASPPDAASLKDSIESSPGSPQEFTISFAPDFVGRATIEANISAWNEQRGQKGCPMSWTDIQEDDSGIARGWAIFQNKNADDYTDDNAQGVRIITPTQIGNNQNLGSAAINNVLTNTDYFLQGGMQLQVGSTFIGWTDDAEDLYPQPFTGVPYHADTQYQFSNTYTNSVWWICAGNDEDLDNEYQCVYRPAATGTHLKESTDTSVWYENASSNSDWYEGFPDTITVHHAKIYRDGIGHAWTSEDRISLHNCGGNQYPIADAMNGSLKNNGTASWQLDGVPRSCQ